MQTVSQQYYMSLLDRNLIFKSLVIYTFTCGIAICTPRVCELKLQFLKL